MDNSILSEIAKKEFEDYLYYYPNENKRLEELKSFVDDNHGSRPFDRKNFKGHITASGFIINGDKSALLLLKHKSLGRWLQPGGHVDESDSSIMYAALREVLEETGISGDKLTLLSTSNDLQIPFDIDSHWIPKNEKKNEEAHYHHDFRYLFQYNDSSEVAINEDESTGFKWVKIEELRDSEDFGFVVGKMKDFL